MTEKQRRQKPAGKPPAGLLVFGPAGRCSSVEDPPGIFSLLAPCRRAKSQATHPFLIYYQALGICDLRYTIYERVWRRELSQSASSSMLPVRKDSDIIRRKATKSCKPWPLTSPS